MEEYQANVIFTVSCFWFAYSFGHATNNKDWGWVALFATIIIDHWIDHFVHILEKW